ncbi:hypothetical protein PHOSAC3_120904 [Mesotoga infera]|nr:hypothetical protein PHOSAC3_120904 [Mesotoga infera]
MIISPLLKEINGCLKILSKVSPPYNFYQTMICLKSRLMKYIALKLLCGLQRIALHQYRL